MEAQLPERKKVTVATNDGFVELRIGAWLPAVMTPADVRWLIRTLNAALKEIRAAERP